MLDFSEMFDNFFVNTNNNDPITSLYALFPALSDSQLKIFVQLQAIAEKYNSKLIKSSLENFKQHKETNKNMNFFNSKAFNKTLEAYSLAEQMRGIKISNQNQVSSDGGGSNGR